jgi:exo-beta-1,3-glucanase (GH17 family)
MSKSSSGSSLWSPNSTASSAGSGATGGAESGSGPSGDAAGQAGHAPARSGSGAGSAPPWVLPAEEHSKLAQGVFDTLAQGIHGLCFSPYLDGQGPGTQLEAPQIRERLAIIQPHARWVRSFSCTEGNELIPKLAKEIGLKTLVGAWLGIDRDINEREIAGAIALAQAGDVDLLAIGNEVLLRGDMGEDELIAYIERVRAAAPGVQVGYVDAYYLFELHPKVTAACDVIFSNCYPFWEGCPLDHAVAYMQNMVRRTQAAAAGKRVVVSETGWPDQGSAFHGAVPSKDAAMHYFQETCRWTAEQGVELFYFAAFDEAWKVGAEGDVGAYWGLWDKNGQFKYPRQGE